MFVHACSSTNTCKDVCACMCMHVCVSAFVTVCMSKCICIYVQILHVCMHASPKRVNRKLYSQIYNFLCFDVKVLLKRLCLAPVFLMKQNFELTCNALLAQDTVIESVPLT